ncbi:MAG: prepilin-type N-terminal cleavage/methylation domain-containing protein [Gemmatimonadota bacterium]
MPRPRGNSGFTLVEVLLVMTVLAVLVALAVPSFQQVTASMRARAALDRLTSEIYRARFLAVQNSYPTRLVLHADPNGCVDRLRLGVQAPGAQESSLWVDLDLPGLCLLHSGDSTLVFNSRGMLRPPGRTFFVPTGAGGDTAVISIAGRVRRSY